MIFTIARNKSQEPRNKSRESITKNREIRTNTGIV